MEKLKEFASNTRRGYKIEKNKIDNELLNEIKKILYVEPNVNKEYVQNVVGIPMYFENKKNIFLPPAWSINNIGKAKKNCIKPGDKLDLKLKLQPRDYQVDIINKSMKQIKEIGGGILTIRPGGGKTYCGINIAIQLKRKTIILVHTSVLLDQWVERINSFVDNAKIGIIKGKVCDIEGKDFVIGMIQTIMNKFDYKTFESFGFVIFDEVHHISSPMFSKTLTKLCLKYKLGLSATPKRTDKTEIVFYNYLGKSILGNNFKEEKIKTLIKNIYYFDNYEEMNRYNGSYDLHGMLEQIITNRYRNKFIVKNALEYAKMGRHIIVLSTRRNHLTYMNNLFKIMAKNTEYTSDLYIGGMKTEELEKSSMNNVIFATYQLVAEGTDIPTLDTLIMASPKKEVEQIIGRIQRGKAKNIPMVIDICDDFSVFSNQSKYRNRHYKKSKYEITNFKLEKKKDIPIIREGNGQVKKLTSFINIKGKTNKKENDTIVLKECLL